MKRYPGTIIVAVMSFALAAVFQRYYDSPRSPGVETTESHLRMKRTPREGAADETGRRQSYATEQRRVC